MKCFKRIIMSHMQTIILDKLDCLQFGYRSNRSTEDAVSTTIHTAITHLGSRNSHTQLDYNSAFKIMIPSKLINKLSTLGTFCNWVLNFLKGRPRSVGMGNHTAILEPAGANPS